MTWTAQWRTKGHLTDAIVILDERGSVHQVIPVTPAVLSRFLTSGADLPSADGATLADEHLRHPEDWGELVLARAGSGEVLEVEPELYWHGIYIWFRSRGVDFDTPEQSSQVPAAPAIPLSVLMDD